jgi:hypothetical protein
MNRLKVVTLFFLLLVLAVPLCAQVSPARTTVNVPFDFVVGDTVMPAGDYTIVSVSETVLKITGETASVFIMTNEKITSQEVSNTKLIFTQENGQHVLHQVWTEGQPHAHNITHAGRTLDVQ